MIPAIQEINFPSYATLHQATASFAEMGERSITTQVRIDGDVVPNFDGWELSFKGERFILNTKDPQAVKDNTTRNSLVDLTFVSWPINELKRYFFFEAASVGAGTAIADKYKAPVNLNVEDFAVLFNQVLNHYFGGKIVFSLYMSGQGQYSTDRALVEINYTYIWDVLVKFFEVYGVRWRIEYNSTTDVYTIKAGWPDASIDDHDFEYGYKGGLLRFERQVQDVDIHNILLGRGGEKNLPYRYFKRVDPQNPDWAADPDAIPELANISFDRLRDINFRWYIRGWMQNPNRDTSWEDDGYVYPTYSNVPAQYQFAYDKGRTDERFNPVEYVRDLPSIEAYGEHWGALDDNDEVFPTIQGVTRDPFGRIDETVAVSEIITDDISAMAQNAAVEKSINRMSMSLYGNTRTEFEILSEEFTIPEGSTGNISYAPFGTDDIYPNLVRFDTENSTLVAVSGDTEYPISAIPAGTYRLKLNMVIARSGQATSATGTYGIENIVLTTSSQDADAWKPTFDIWVKNIWNTAPQQGESDAQYAERVWLPILGDRAGNEAKIVFSSGFMSVSEDYEFTIASYPVRDTSKSINGVPSEWRITLRKSDAEFDATGLYIPNASTGGKPVAGDKFFFIGIDMPHMYVTLAEEDLNTNKSAQLDTEAAVNPTWIMNLDKVRVHTLEDDEYGQTLADRLAAGTKVWITDPRFTPGRKLQLYIQSITYTWNEPTDESPYIVPDIEVVLSDKVVATDSVVQRIQNDVSSIKNQYARISDVEAVVRSVAEPIFLKKTGESDSSDSPTQFSSKVTSKGFRQGGIGGKGWGIYRDNTSDFAEGEEGEGDTVIEVDRIVARKELQVNSLVVNQIAYRGGMEVISAAKIEVSKVIETDTEYICYFDQRRNSVANSFIAGDIAMGMIFNAANTAVERYYKAIVTATDIDCIHLSKTQKVGAGAPAVGDTIIQYGNPTNTARQYVIVRDVIGGGYERMISGLNSLNTDGDEYYFAGKQSGESGPRWFVGSHAENGDYAEYVNGVLTIKANVIFKAGQVIPGIADLTEDIDALEYLKTALPKSDTIISGGLILSKVIALRDSNDAIKSGINGDPTLSNIAAWYGGPMADKYETPTPQDYAKSIFRFDGSGYLAGGNIRWDDQGYGGIPGITWSNDGTNDIVTIGANVRLASVDGDTVTDLLNAVNSIKDWFELVDGNIHVKNNRGFWTGGFISAGGISPGGGASAGNATLVAQTYGGTLSATGIEGINFYSKERVDQLLLTAGTVQTVAGVSPTNGDIPVASLKSALGLGAAAAYGVGSVASGNTGLVTGGSVYSAINEAVSSVMKLQGTTTTPISDGSTTNPVVIDGSSYTAKKGDVVLYDGKEYLWAGSAWEQLGDEASWALKTTTISAGTGLEGGGTLASNRTISLSAASIASLALADSAYQKPSTGIPQTDLASALSTKVNHGESAYNDLNDWFEIVGGNIHVKGNRGFYSDSFISAGGLSSGGGSGGIDPEAMWQLLGAQTNEQIAASHLTTALRGYLPLAGGTMSNTNVVTNLNADLLDGYHASTSDTPWGTIPVINANGWMDIGKHLEFHFDNSPGIDYSTVLQCTGNWANVVSLPSRDGTLALTSDLSAYVAKSGDTMTGSLTIDDPNANFVRNFKFYSTTGWARNIVDLTVDGVSKFVIGALGDYIAGASNNGITYAYIGVNDYNGTNLRFGSDSTLKWGTYSIYHQGNLSLSTLAGSTQIGSSTQPVYYNGTALVATDLSTTYAPYNSAGYLPLSGGTMTGAIQIGSYTAFGVSGSTFYLGSPAYPVNLRSNGTTQINGNTIWHSGNSNLSTVPWTCSSLYMNGGIENVTTITTANGSDYGLRYRTDPTWASWARSALQIYTDNTIMHVGAYGDAGTQISYAFFGEGYDSGYAIRVYPGSYPTVGSNIIWHSGNSNKSDVAWEASNLTLHGYASGVTNIDSLLYFDTTNSHVGIGASPNYLLDVVNTNNSNGWTALFKSANSDVCVAHGGGYGLAIESTSSSSGIYLLNCVYGQSVVGYGGTSALCVRADGNVGIGTTAPAYKLDVNGSIGCGNLSTNGYISGAGPFQTNRAYYGLSVESVSNPVYGVNMYMTHDAGKTMNAYRITTRLQVGFSIGLATGLAYDYAFPRGATYNECLTIDTSGSVRLRNTLNVGALEAWFCNAYYGNGSASAGPAAGSLKTGTIGLCAASNNYGLYAWCNYFTGQSNMQSGRADGANTEMYSLCLNPMGGNVGVNTFSPSCALDVAGVIHSSTGIWSEGYVSAGGLASSSDERLKSGIKDFGYSAEMLMALRPREWDWNEKSYMKGHAAGVVAQELQQVMPYAIVERQYLSVNYDMLHGLEIAGLQDHESRIRQLERENAELKRRLNMN